MSANSHTAMISEEQAEKLRGVLEQQGFEFGEKPYTLFSAKKGKLNVSVYQKGPKVLVQGRETGDFVRFTLEPEILGEARLGYEEVHQPEMFEPHFGIDESGKGDYFGPLVVALIVGTPALSLIGALGGALAVVVRRASILMTILVAPLYLPTWIFGVAAASDAGVAAGAALLFLGATSLLAWVVAPIAGASALRANMS